MRQKLRAVIGLAALGVAAGGLVACDPLPVKQSFRDSSTFGAKVGSVRLANGAGDVTLTGTAAAGSAISVHRTVRYDRGGDKPSGATARVEGGVLVLDGCGAGTRDCSVDYTVAVPAGTPVNGAVTSGDVRLSGVGAVSLAATSGDVTLDGVTGATRVEATSGDVRVTAAAAHDLRVATTSGDVRVRVPSTPYRLAVTTGSGDRRIAVPNASASPHHLAVKTTSGDITVQH
ncbi:hypothetical protein BIV57_21150 [Mangrovactinospora gilvigrisea]|uniref:DUF4097 domain-containing protein n=1 Tax=Mangrovactinospora gilvigrisea TaxID=1428644 RepID=A0A1J7C782_9ACTN|nr:DUF4097 family beta strand repeat-containing protein [Mangrovactinospora gilvigrisea]OIV35506.1 hypothetical protein BIV57_21150 [Mangrovactinospora gilvigrisea]